MGKALSKFIQAILILLFIFIVIPLLYLGKGLVYLFIAIFQKQEKKPKYIYGICNDQPARKNRKTGVVEFVLWKAGEQGHKEDYWHTFGEGWSELFKPTNADEN